MVTIRMTRIGRKKIAKYRIVVTDSRNRRDGAFLDKLGEYSPSEPTAAFRINHERALYWLSKGAQMSNTVRSLFHRDGIVKKQQLAAKGLDATTVTVERKGEKARKAAPSKKKNAKAKTEQAAPAPAAEQK